MNAAAVIAEALVSGPQPRGVLSGGVVKVVVDDVAAAVLDALAAAGFAVVELPEPEEREDEHEITTAWDVLPWQALVWDTHPDEVQVSYDCEPSEPLSPAVVRDLAAALLAAADKAEEAGR